MSFLTATNTELIYNMYAAGTDIAVSTAQIFTANSTTNPPAYLPPVYSIWQPSTVPGKGMSFRMGGTFDLSGAANNTFQYGLNTTQATTTPATPFATTGAAAWTNTTTGIWHAQVDLVFFSSGTGTHLNAYTDGLLVVGLAAGTNAATVYPLASAANTTPTTVTAIAPTTAWYAEGSFTWSAAPTHSACQRHMVFGLN